jgi:hypothetical protein
MNNVRYLEDEEAKKIMYLNEILDIKKWINCRWIPIFNESAPSMLDAIMLNDPEKKKIKRIIHLDPYNKTMLTAHCLVPINKDNEHNPDMLIFSVIHIIKLALFFKVFYYHHLFELVDITNIFDIIIDAPIERLRKQLKEVSDIINKSTNIKYDFNSTTTITIAKLYDIASMDTYKNTKIFPAVRCAFRDCIYQKTNTALETYIIKTANLHLIQDFTIANPDNKLQEFKYIYFNVYSNKTELQADYHEKITQIIKLRDINTKVQNLNIKITTIQLSSIPELPVFSLYTVFDEFNIDESKKPFLKQLFKNMVKEIKNHPNCNIKLAEEQCPICLDNKSLFITTSCAHKFCKVCIQQHLKSCPICRNTFTLSDTEHLVLCTIIPPPRFIAGALKNKYIRTVEKHTDSKGVSRTIYIKNKVKYVKMKKDNKFIYKKIRLAR